MNSSPGFRYLVGAILLAAALVVMPASMAQASPITYTAILSGLAEDPPNASPGTGFATVVFDAVAHTMDINVWFSGLTGLTTASHIHAATACPGSAPPPWPRRRLLSQAFPLGWDPGPSPAVST